MSVNRRLPISLREDLFTGTDLVKMIVVVSFSAVSLMLTAVAPDYGVYPACSLIYCIPILLAALWYPRQGLRVTAFLVAGFALIRTYLSALGFAVDPVMTGLHMMIFFWVFGAATLFSQAPHLAISRCRQVVENTRDAKFLCDPETLRLLCASRRCADILGYAPHELIGTTAEKFWPDEADRARFAAEMEREGYIGNTETTFRTKNGEDRAVLVSCRALTAENLFECTVVDTGRLGDGRAALIQTNGRLTELIHQSNDIFFMQDAAGRILHFSWLRAAEHGISPETLVGQGVDALLPADLAAQHTARFQEVVEDRKNARYDLDLELAGTRHAFSVTMAPYYGEDGSLIGVAGSARDITEIRRQKLAGRQMTLEVDQWKGLVPSSPTAAHAVAAALGYLQMITEDPGHYGLTGRRRSPYDLLVRRQEQAVVERGRVEPAQRTTSSCHPGVPPAAPFRHLSGGYDKSGFTMKYRRRPSWEIAIGFQVMELVSNAVKYNEPPKYGFAMRNQKKSLYYGAITVSVSVPIPSIDLGPFYRGPAGRNGGEGLRLIVNKYVQPHGGR